MSDNKEKSIFELELNETVFVAKGIKVTRVPGGWVYTHIQSLSKGIETKSQSISSVFVPLHTEFKEKGKNSFGDSTAI